MSDCRHSKPKLPECWGCQGMGYTGTSPKHTCNRETPFSDLQFKAAFTDIAWDMSVLMGASGSPEVREVRKRLSGMSDEQIMKHYLERQRE